MKLEERGPVRTTSDKIIERIPPIIGFILIFFPIVMSFIHPVIAAIYIIIINVYFLYKSIAGCVQFALSLWRIHISEQQDWRQKANALENIPLEIENLKKELEIVRSTRFKDFKKEENEVYKHLDKFSKNLEKNTNLPYVVQRFLFRKIRSKSIASIKKEIKFLERLKDKNLIKPSELQHIIIIPHVNEPISLLRQALECLKNQTFNTKQINIVLASEAALPNGIMVSEQLKEEYKEYFNNIWTTNHVLQSDEIVGKSANMRWAGLHLYEEVQKLGWDLEKTTITSCDSDSKIDPQYYSYLTYEYITTPNSKYKLFAGALVFYNNIWRLPFYARVKNSFSSIYNVSKLVRTDKYVPVSTYSLSFWLIKEIDFWTPWIVPEDYHIFFKCLFLHKEKVSTIPIYLKIMSDAAEGDDHWSTIKNNYKQSRRWAWGISDTGWMLYTLLKNWFKWPFKVTYMTAHTVFDHITGPVVAILIFLGGNLPVLLNPDFANEVAGARLPEVSRLLVRSTIIFLLIIIFLDFYLKPRPDHYPWWKRITRLLEWFSQPIAGFLLAALPSLEAQSRLVFGKYMDAHVNQEKKGAEEEKVHKDKAF